MTPRPGMNDSLRKLCIGVDAAWRWTVVDASHSHPLPPFVTPEAALGGPIALLRDGDRLTIDARKRSIDMAVSATELRARKKKWRAPKPYTNHGVLAKYARLVSSARGTRGARFGSLPGARRLRRDGQGHR